MSLVVVVFLGEELILYIELTVETWSCWIACGNTVVLVGIHCIGRNPIILVELLETLLDSSWTED